MHRCDPEQAKADERRSRRLGDYLYNTVEGLSLAGVEVIVTKVVPGVGSARVIQVRPVLSWFRPDVIGLADVPGCKGYRFATDPFPDSLNGDVIEAMNRPGFVGDSILSRNGVSDKPGAVHLLEYRLSSLWGGARSEGTTPLRKLPEEIANRERSLIATSWKDERERSHLSLSSIQKRRLFPTPMHEETRPSHVPRKRAC